MTVTQKLAPLTQHHGVRQFVKFAIVGASSTAINFVVLNSMLKLLGRPLWEAVTLAFLTSVCNGFFWNRRWTFKEARSGNAGEQGMKFFLVNIVGWTLNMTIVALTVAHFTAGNQGGLFGDPETFKRIIVDVMIGHKSHNLLIVNIAQLAATCVVVFWNYFANRTWTFKHAPAEPAA